MHLSHFWIRSMEERDELHQALALEEAVYRMESLLGGVSLRNKEKTEDYQARFKLKHKVADGALEADWGQAERPSGEVED